VALPDSQHNQLAKGDLEEDSSSGGSSDAAAAAAAPGSSDAGGSSDGQGAKGASSAAADGGTADDSSSQPTPTAVEGLAGDASGETVSPAAAAVPDARAKAAAAAAELPEMGGEGPAITPADFAATGLAALEAEADSAAAAGGGSAAAAAAAAADRSTSVMTDRTDSGWYERSYSSMMPSSAVELAGMDKSPGGFQAKLMRCDFFIGEGGKGLRVMCRLRWTSHQVDMVRFD
jgi:hypothetical protein